MEKYKYTIKYLPTFIYQFNDILYYITNELGNKMVADNFYQEVVSKIEQRSEFPTAFEIFKKSEVENINWYKIKVKNYTIFYTVKNNVMEIRRIFYSRRNFDKLIK